MKKSLLPLIFLLLFTTAWSQKTNKNTNKDTNSIPDIPVWYLKTQDKNVNLFVKEYGVGDTIVVVHGGFGAEHSYLLDAFKDLGKKHHFVFYDQRGSLRSPAPDSLISIDKHVEDIEVLRKELNIERLNIVGHSMGTLVSSFYLEKYPEHVERLTLLALAYPKTAESKEEELFFEEQKRLGSEFVSRPEIQSEIIEEGFDRDRDSFSSKDTTNDWRIRFAGVNIYNVERWREVKGGMVFYNQRAGTAAGRSLPESWNHFKTYKEVSVPITIINGTHDFVDIDGKVFSKLSKNIDNVEYVLLDKAGHNAWIDRPDVFYNILEKGLTKMLNSHKDKL